MGVVYPSGVDLVRAAVDRSRVPERRIPRGVFAQDVELKRRARLEVAS
jgi:hypothetical protein